METKCDIHFTGAHSIEATFTTVVEAMSLVVEIAAYGFHVHYIPIDAKTILWNADFLRTSEYHEFSVGERRPGDEEILHTSKQTVTSRNKQNHSVEFRVEFDLHITQIRVAVDVRTQ